MQDLSTPTRTPFKWILLRSLSTPTPTSRCQHTPWRSPLQDDSWLAGSHAAIRSLSWVIPPDLTEFTI